MLTCLLQPRIPLQKSVSTPSIMGTHDILNKENVINNDVNSIPMYVILSIINLYLFIKYSGLQLYIYLEFLLISHVNISCILTIYYFYIYLLTNYFFVISLRHFI